MTTFYWPFPVRRQMTKKEMDREECKATIQTFINGGSPGLARLHQVLPNVFLTYGIKMPMDQMSILQELKLNPVLNGDQATFYLDIDAEDMC